MRVLSITPSVIYNFMNLVYDSAYFILHSNLLLIKTCQALGVKNECSALAGESVGGDKSEVGAMQAHR